MLINPSPLDSFGNKLRELRKKKNLSVAELAKKLDVTSAYLYRLENDLQVPGDGLTEDLARLLDGSKTDFLEWVKASRDLKRQPPIESEYQSNPLRISGHTARDIEFRMAPPGKPWPAPEKGRLGPIPVLMEGSDPAAEKRIVDRILFIREQSIPPEEKPVEGFAYQISERGLGRIKNRGAEPGDFLVFSSEQGPIKADEIYAVRQAKRIVLSRVLEKKDLLLLLTDGAQEEIDVVRLEKDEGRSPIAGRLVIVIRTAYRMTVLDKH
jgi:transcriptional regulator with XRE-family HTH domain